MTQMDRVAGPLHDAAVPLVIICLFGWASLLWLEPVPSGDQRGGNQRGGNQQRGGEQVRANREFSPLGPEPLLKISLNDASASELELLPNIGPQMAARMLRYRQQNGDFESWSDLQKVAGMGPSTARAIRPYCDLSAAARVDQGFTLQYPPITSADSMPRREVRVVASE